MSAIRHRAGAISHRAGAFSHRALVAATTASVVVLVAAVCFFRPGSGSGPAVLLPPCPFHALTGLYCPGCGATRMLYFLVHGHFAQAWRENALAMLMLPVILYGLIRQWMANGAATFTRIPARWIFAFAAVVILFTIARNLPWQPFQMLAPVEIAQLQ